MLTDTRAIVLHTTKYGERRLLATMFTRENGLCSFSAAATPASRGRARGVAHYLQPMSVLEVEYDHRPRATVQAIGNVRLAYAPRTLPFDAFKLSISLFLAEFLRFALREQPADAALYDFVEQSLQWLDTAETDFANFHIVFMVRLSRFIGFFPNMENFAPGTWFDLQEGDFSPLSPTHSQALRPEDASVVAVVARLSYQTMHLLRLSRAERNQCVETILKYYRQHLPSFPEMKSLAVLRELF